MAPYVRRILLRVHAPGSAGGCEEQQERRCAPRYGSVHFSATDFAKFCSWTLPFHLYYLLQYIRNHTYCVFRL